MLSLFRLGLLGLRSKQVALRKPRLEQQFFKLLLAGRCKAAEQRCSNLSFQQCFSCLAAVSVSTCPSCRIANHPIFIDEREAAAVHGNKRFPSDKKDRQPLGKGCGQDSGIKRLQASLCRIRECVRRVPAIRPEKVTDMRSKVSSGSWNPASARVAEKVLCEHLFDPAVL